MSGGTTWTRNDIGDLTGRTAVVTGGSGGIGFETARWLAANGASVVLGCRDRDRGARAAEQMTGIPRGPGAAAEVLDLADLSSVRRFADRVRQRHPGIDILVNNAGIAGGPRRVTADGFEAHFGTNHLGHFALTGLLLPALLSRPGARIATLASSVAAQGRINFADLNSQHRYRFIAAYSQSKLANLMFALELARRARASAMPLVSTAVNPGIVATGLLRPGRGPQGSAPRPAELAVAAVQRLYGQPPAEGCLTSLYAVTAPGLAGGEYVIPDGRGHKRGNPVAGNPPARALDPETARLLWETSATLTGISYTALDATRA